MAVMTAFVFAGLVSTQTFAQSTKVNQSTNVMKVTPVRSDIQINAGESKTVQVTVSNITSSPITVSAIENDFVSGDESGSPALILDEGAYAPTHSLKRFMTPIKNVTIPAGKSVTVKVVITVPKTAQAGGYFGAVRFAPVSSADGGQVNLSPNAASLILLTVPGPVTEKLNLTDFNVQQNGKTGDFFSSPKDIATLIRFENKGNVQEGPFGNISVKNGKKVVYSTDFNTNESRDQILPDGARRWTVPLKDLGEFGHYTVTATLTYGQKNQTVEVVKTFWVIPQYFVYIAIAAVLLVVALIVFLVLFILKRRRHHVKRPNVSRYRR
jgi:hypothetical protein